MNRLSYVLPLPLPPRVLARPLAALRTARTPLAGRAPFAGRAALPAAALAALPAVGLALGALGLLAWAPPRAAAEELQGRVVLLTKDGRGPARGSDPTQAVVYFESAAPGHGARAPEKPFQLVTHFKEFTPHVMAVPVGSRVQFPNLDPILHNVFSVSPGNAFDLGIYRNGPPKEKRFEQPGLVRVFCNVHQAMVAYIMVLDTPFYTSPAADGTFRFSGLPKGPGKLTVWHEQADPWTAEVTLPHEAGSPPITPIEARLLVIRPKLPPHTNKTGGTYSRGDDYR